QGLVSFFFQAEDGIRGFHVTGVQTCALPICPGRIRGRRRGIWRVDGAGRMMGRPPAAADAAGTLVEALAALLPAGSDLALAWAEIGRASWREGGWSAGAAGRLAQESRDRARP